MKKILESHWKCACGSMPQFITGNQEEAFRLTETKMPQHVFFTISSPIQEFSEKRSIKISICKEIQVLLEEHHFPPINASFDFSMKHLEYLIEKKMELFISKGFKPLLSLNYEDKIVPIVLSHVEKKLTIITIDFDNWIENILYEKFTSTNKPFFIQKLNYHFIPIIIRKWIERKIFRIKHKDIIKKTRELLNDKSDTRFQQLYNDYNWPLDIRVEYLRYITISILKLVSGTQIPYIALWPNGKSCAMSISHDVDSKFGLDYLENFVKMENEQKIKASCFIRGDLFLEEDSENKIKEYNTDSDINIHGWDHSGLETYGSKNKQEKYFKQISEIRESNSILGYRSPMLLRTSNQNEFLKQSRFSYDSTAPTTDLSITGQSGTQTIFPFYQKDHLLEIPITFPMDYVYIMMNLKPKEMELLNDLLSRYIIALGGLIHLNYHPEPFLSADPIYIELLANFIANRNENTIFIASLEQIYSWWNYRNETKIEWDSKSNKYTIKTKSNYPFQPKINWF